MRTVARNVVRRSGPPAGFALPYSLDNVLSTWGDCRDGGRRQHNGIDLGGVGEHHGLGTPVRSMIRARVTMIGTGDQDPGRFGNPDTRGGETERGGLTVPREARIAGYGLVHFFTRDLGSWGSGTIITTEGEDGVLAGYRIRYLHLAAVHPSLAVGDLVDAGQEIGLMGGTAVQSSTPHVHIDIEDTNGQRVDVAPFLGLEPDTTSCATAR